MHADPTETGPRANREPAVVESKRARTHEPHLASLTKLVEEMRTETGGEVPWFDPDSGGVDARALFLMEASGARSTARRPGGKTIGSGFISLDNDDGTAEALWRLIREADLPRRALVMWNIVPWYIGSASRIRAPGRDDLEQARPYLRRLLERLPHLRVVLTLGRKAQRGWSAFTDSNAVPVVRTGECPHPSPQNLRTRPEARKRILEALLEVRGAL